MLLSELTKRISDTLKQKGLEVKQIGFNDLINGVLNVTTPAVNVTIKEAESKLLNNVTYNWKVIVSLILVVQYPKEDRTGDFERMEKIFALIESMQKFLMLQDFGLELQNRMIPQKFKNITTREFAKAGYRVFYLEFWMSYNTTYESPEDYSTGPLTEIDLSYWTEPQAGIPPTGDSTVAAVINLV
jgi:hypothetical protein